MKGVGKVVLKLVAYFRSIAENSSALPRKADRLASARVPDQPPPVAKLRVRRSNPMGRQAIAAVYVIVMAAAIVGMDIAFFRDRLPERLLANISIVLLAAAFYLRFFGRPWLPWH